jgi:hypothetical protein
MNDAIRERQQAERTRAGVEIPSDCKVSMVIACYRNIRKILLPLASLINQTHENWEAIIVHDGSEGSCEVWDVVNNFCDPRLRYHELPLKSNDWGNSSKEYGSQLATGNYIGHSNDDNFYAPVYFEWMLRSLIENQAQFAYCDMVHSHRQYQPMTCEPRACHIDGGGWLCQAGIVKATPWPTPKNDGHADGHYVEALVSRCGRVTHVPHYLFTHN